MPAPTLTSSATSTWSDNVGTDEVTGTLTWAAGDRILVVAMTEDQGYTLSVPTATGLTFTALGAAVTVSDSCWLHAWQATAGGAGLSAITAGRATGTGVAMRGLAAFAWAGCTGFTRTNKSGVNATKVVSMTRGQANSAVVFWAGDWSAGGIGGIGWTPAGQTQVIAQANTGATGFVGHWPDQGAVGATNYGVTGVPGTAFTAAAVEVLGTVSSNTTATGAEVAGAATAYAPVPAVTVQAGLAGAGAAALDAAGAGSGGGGDMQSLFTDQVPGLPDNSDGAPGITCGVTLRFASDGVVPGIRFYATSSVSGTYTAALYTVDSSDPGTGTAVAVKTLGPAPTPGTWNSITFDTPAEVTAGVPYRAAVFSSAGRYVATLNFFTSDLVNGDITADAHNDTVGPYTISQGVYRIASDIGYPNSAGGGGTNYFIDVAFTTDSAPAVVASAEPALAGATAYQAAASTSTAVVASAECALAGAAAPQPAVSIPGGTQSLYTNQTPAIANNTDGAPGVTLGVTLRFATDGAVSGVRFYSTTEVGGTYAAALYQVQASDPGSGAALASKTLAGLPVAGTWNTITFDAPVAVAAGVAYRAALWNSEGRYVATSGLHSTDLVNGGITADADGDTVGGYTIFQGTYRTGAPIEYPNSPASGGGYFVDVEYSTGTAVVAQAEVAQAGAAAPFVGGTDLSLTMVADAPVEAAAAALDAVPQVVARAEVAAANALAYNATATSIVATIAQAQVALAGAGAPFESGTAVSVLLIADAPIEVAAAAFDAVPVVVARAEVAVAAALALPAVVVSTGVAALSAASGLMAGAFRETRASTVVLSAASSLAAQGSRWITVTVTMSAAGNLVAVATTSDSAPVIAYAHSITRTKPGGTVLLSVPR